MTQEFNPPPADACKLMFPDDKKKQKRCKPLVRTLRKSKGFLTARAKRAIEKLQALQYK